MADQDSEQVVDDPRLYILLVEDHLATAERYGYRLALEGYRVSLASDGVEGLTMARQARPDMMVLDIRMPRMDGVEATKRIRARFPNVRVLMLSAFDDRDLVFSAVEAGARGYILKDREADHLIEAVRSVVSGQFVVDPKLASRQSRTRTG